MTTLFPIFAMCDQPVFATIPSLRAIVAVFCGRQAIILSLYDDPLCANRRGRSRYKELAEFLRPSEAE